MQEQAAEEARQRLAEQEEAPEHLGVRLEEQQEEEAPEPLGVRLEEQQGEAPEPLGVRLEEQQQAPEGWMQQGEALGVARLQQ